MPEQTGRLVLGTPQAALVAALLHRSCGDAALALSALARERVPAAAADAVACAAWPGLAADERWRAAVEAGVAHEQRVERALAVTAAALGRGQVRSVLAPSALGPLWMRDIDLILCAGDVGAAVSALTAAGFVDFRELLRSSAGPSTSFAALSDGEVLAAVDISTRLLAGGPSAGAVLAQATVHAEDALPTLSLEHQLLRRAGKILAMRRVGLRDALELSSLLAAAGASGHDPLVVLAASRVAPFERDVGVHGPLLATAAAKRAPLARHWLRARGEGAVARVRMRRRAQLRVSFSGIDGAGKSTQAAQLVDTLDRAGVKSVAVWARLGYSGSPLLTKTARVAQRLLPARHHSAQRERASGTSASRPTPLSRRGALGWTWAMAVTLDYLRILRRESRRVSADALIYDRGTADALVALDEEFGGALDLRLHAWLVRRLTPRIDFAFYLRLPGRAAHDRKLDSFAADVLEAHVRRYEEILPTLSVPVETLDAMRPPADLSREILGRLGTGGRP